MGYMFISSFMEAFVWCREAKIEAKGSNGNSSQRKHKTQGESVDFDKTHLCQGIKTSRRVKIGFKFKDREQKIALFFLRYRDGKP